MRKDQQTGKRNCLSIYRARTILMTACITNSWWLCRKYHSSFATMVDGSSKKKYHIIKCGSSLQVLEVQKLVVMQENSQVALSSSIIFYVVYLRFQLCQFCCFNGHEFYPDEKRKTISQPIKLMYNQLNSRGSITWQHVLISIMQIS